MVLPLVGEYVTAFLLKNLQFNYWRFFFDLNFHSKIFEKLKVSTTALLKFKSNLAYNHKVYPVEDILQRAFIEGSLEEQASKLDFDYLELSKKGIDIPKPKQKKQRKKG